MKNNIKILYFNINIIIFQKTLTLTYPPVVSAVTKTIRHLKDRLAAIDDNDNELLSTFVSCFVFRDDKIYAYFKLFFTTYSFTYYCIRKNNRIFSRLENEQQVEYV